MSRNGQRRRFRPARPVAVFDLPLAKGARTGLHRHPFGQLVHAARGSMRVEAAAGAWVVPPGRAVWVPRGVEHEVRAVTAVRMHTVYLTEAALPDAPGEVRVVEVSPLLKELIAAALALPRPYPLGGREERLFRVLVDHLTFQQVVPVYLPRARGPRSGRVVEALEKAPDDGRTLRAWAALTGSSARTLARAFVQETGLTFGAYRSQLRLLRALELLAGGAAVTEVALALGYESLSAFIAAFRRHLGTTPGRYFATSGSGASAGGGRAAG